MKTVNTIVGKRTLLASGRLTTAYRDPSDLARDDVRFPDCSRLYWVDSFGLNWRRRCPVGSLISLRDGGDANEGWIVRYADKGVLVSLRGRTLEPRSDDAFEVYELEFFDDALKQFFREES
jgi:hypothetical protein